MLNRNVSLIRIISRFIEERRSKYCYHYDFVSARLAIFEYIEAWYNSRSSIGYITPKQCEDRIKKVF